MILVSSLSKRSRDAVTVILLWYLPQEFPDKHLVKEYFLVLLLLDSYLSKFLLAVLLEMPEASEACRMCQYLTHSTVQSILAVSDIAFSLF